MTTQISAISSGQLIDQNILSNMITAITEVQNAQYNAQSSIGDLVNNNTYAPLQNGQWIVNTGNKSFSVAKQNANIVQSVTGTVTFQSPFKTGSQPIVVASLFSTSGSNAPIQSAISSIVITSTSATGFSFIANIFSTSAITTASGFIVQYIAIGQSNI